MHATSSKRSEDKCYFGNKCVLSPEFVKGTVNGDSFYDFLRGTLIPMMQPFNGTNAHSVLIMDNCSVHHMSEVKDLLA